MDDAGVYLEAVALDSPSDREAFLRRQMGVDGPQRRALDGLLRTHDSLTPSFRIPNGSARPESTVPPLDFLNPSERPKSLGLLCHHEVVRVLQSDTSGVVLEGYDTKLKRVVAIRVLSSGSHQSIRDRERFQQLATAASAISNRHVTRVLGGGEQNDTPYVVTEVSLGRSLQQHFADEGPCSSTEMLRIAHELAQGLAAIHSAGLIHGDLCPESIFLAGTEQRVKLHLHWSESNVGETEDVIKPDCGRASEFMSPEQASCQSVDHRSDLFSLGAVFHSLATAESPFAASSLEKVKDRICQESPVSIREHNPEIPSWLDDLVFRLMAKVPDARPQSAQEVLERFSDHSDYGTTAKPPLEHNFTSRRTLNRPSRVLQVFDWSFRIVAVVCAIATIVCWYVVTSFEQRELGPYWGLIRGAGSIEVRVDDPRIDVTVKSASIHRHFRGSHRTLVPAGSYLLTASLDGQPIRQETLWLKRFENAEWVVDKDEALRAVLERDPDGYAARWLLRRGGAIHGYWSTDVHCIDTVRSAEQLPASRFFLESVELRNLYPADLSVACQLLASCSRLKTLSIRDSNLTGSSLRQIARLSSLQTLDLTHVFEAEASDFSALAALPELREISLDYSPHAYAFCEAIGGMRQLRSVAISDCPMTDTMVLALCNRADLESLAVRSRFLTGVALDHLAGMKSLKYLELRSPLLTDELWDKLSGLKQLQSLKLGSFPATGPKIALTDSLILPPNLHELALANVVLNHRLLMRVSELTQLSKLEFLDSEVEGDSLQQLANLPSLRSLRFLNVVASRHKLLTLQDQLPRCEVAIMSGEAKLR